MEYPKYLVRPSDYTVFVELPDEPGMYSVKIALERFPNNIHHKYEYDILLSLGWYECAEEDLPEIQKKHDRYYAFLSWQSRSDGHGGSKGGTMEEFEAYEKRVEEYQKQNKTKNNE